MASLISNFILQTLCQNDGGLDFRSLQAKLSLHFTVDERVLRSVLFDRDRIVIRGSRAGSSAESHILSPDSLVVAKTSLRLCQKKTGQCPGCGGLHLCKYLVCGSCTYGQNCTNPHSLLLEYNQQLLRKHDLQGLTEKQLFLLLLLNDPFLLPEICSYYNRGNGLHGTCTFASGCNKLHVCQHFFQGDCRFDVSCKRSHTIDKQGMKNLNLSQENMQNLKRIYEYKYVIVGQNESRTSLVAVPPEPRKPNHPLDSSNPTSSRDAAVPVSDTERNEICLFFIRDCCSYKEKCVHVHWHLPYKWQVLSRDGITWDDLPNMEEIEKAYCDPGNDTSKSAKSVDFITMTCGESPVRRLSTTSSVSKPSHFILTTQWLWYWESNPGKWLEYGQSDGKCSASINSETLEKTYLGKTDTQMSFSAGEQLYTLRLGPSSDGQPMQQRSVKSNRVRFIRRRPRFVSLQEVELQKNRQLLCEGCDPLRQIQQGHRGRSSCVRSPPKGQSKDLYVSCVDSAVKSTIFIIFEKHQLYLEYLINYSFLNETHKCFQVRHLKPALRLSVESDAR